MSGRYHAADLLVSWSGRCESCAAMVAHLRAHLAAPGVGPAATCRTSDFSPAAVALLPGRQLSATKVC